MKKITINLLFILLSIFANAKTFNFKLINKTGFELQIFYQIIQAVEKGNPEFVFNIASNSQKSIALKLKKNQKIKIIGYGGNVETLPIVRSFENLKGEVIDLELVLPKVEKINIVDLNDALSKIKNDNYLKILLDSSQYSKDEMPILGTFVFYNLKNNTSLKLTPTFWKNTKEIRSLNNQNFETVDYVNSSNSMGLNLSGIPFLQKLGASFSNSNILEISWKISNAHIEQWQPTNKNVFDIIQDPSSRSFIDACVSEMNGKGLGGGEYNLFFISSALVVDSMKVSAKKYNRIDINADVEVQLSSPNLEIVKPSVSANYGYSREKLYSNIDNSSTLYLKFLAQDYTPVLNTYINQTAKSAQKQTALNNLATLKSSILSQYKILHSIDETLISTEQLEVILPIIDVTIDLELQPEQFDENGNNISTLEIKNFNRKAIQFNSILKNCKELISQYKATIESIEKLNQPTDYYKILNSISAIELDKKVIDSFVKQQNIQH